MNCIVTHEMQTMKIHLLFRRPFFVFILIVVLQFVACKKDQPTTSAPVPETYSITINLSHYFGDQLLKYDTVKYVTAANDTIIISQIEYYFSNIRLTRSDQTIISPEAYFLIDFSNPASASIMINNIPKGTYNQFSFLLGVDSTHNHSGAQTGALDPANNMFWGWNTGYVFYRVKGYFNAAHSSFSFDLGGDANEMKYAFQTNISLDANRTINLKMDMKELFQNPYNYNLKVDDKDIHSTTASGIAKLVQNSKDMITVTSIQ